jgi:type II secretory pathway component HofQ
MVRILVTLVLSAAIGPLAALAQDKPPPKPGNAKAPSAKPEAPKPKPPAPVVKPAPEGVSSEEAIEKALAVKTTCEFLDTPLEDVVEYLRDLHKINVILDKKALADAGTEAKTTVSLKVSGVALRSALDLVLRPLGLAWTIHNEVLLITTEKQAESMLVTKVYPVADLVAPEGAAPGAEGDHDFDSLVDVITASVAPASWDVAGGAGSITVAPLGKVNALVISQTYDAHARVGKLLADLRKVAAEKP